MAQSIALILGHDAARANDYAPNTLSQALSVNGADVLVALGGPSALNRQSVNGSIDDVLRRQGPRLIFGVLNGRTPPPGSYCQNLFGGGADLNDLMNRITKGANDSGQPVDVFLLLASTPRFIHGHVQSLPRGSTIIAIETTARSRDSRHLWALLQQPALHKGKDITARSLLLATMLGADENYGMPEIAVSGQPRIDIRDVWDDLVHNGKPKLTKPVVSDAVRDELRSISQYMALPQADGLEHAIRTINNQPQHVKPLDNQYYACAVASLWQQFFVASPAAPMAVIAPVAAPTPAPAVRKAAATPAAPAPAPVSGSAHKKPRLSSSQVGSLYKPGKPLHQQHPAVIKRLLHRG